jgi:putative iron-only hydrogenase system regulator
MGETTHRILTSKTSFETKEGSVRTRLAVLSIIVENPDSTEPLNALLHEVRTYIIGRLGIPYRRRGISVISIILDAPQNTTNALAGSIGKLDGVTVKAAYSTFEFDDEDLLPNAYRAKG